MRPGKEAGRGQSREGVVASRRPEAGGEPNKERVPEDKAERRLEGGSDRLGIVTDVRVANVRGGATMAKEHSGRDIIPLSSAPKEATAVPGTSSTRSGSSQTLRISGPGMT